jgi:outer membrane lipopolysaccharide assembly protein LptE/RlpB
MSKRYVASFVICLAALAGLGACNHDMKGRTTDPQVLQTQLQSALPLGASAQAVEAYLVANGYDPSGLIDNKTMAHMGKDPTTYEVLSIVRATRTSLFVRTDLQLTFTFDQAKKLTAIKVAEVHTGP